MKIEDTYIGGADLKPIGWREEFDKQFSGNLAEYDNGGEGGYDPRPYIKDFIAKVEKESCKVVADKYREKIKECLDYCRFQNGMSMCKNCGLSEKDI